MNNRKKIFRLGQYQLIKAIENYKNDPDLKDNGGYKYMMNASTFFNGRYTDYLLESPKKILKQIRIENISNQRKLL